MNVFRAFGRFRSGNVCWRDDRAFRSERRSWVPSASPHWVKRVGKGPVLALFGPDALARRCLFRRGKADIAQEHAKGRFWRKAVIQRPRGAQYCARAWAGLAPHPESQRSRRRAVTQPSSMGKDLSTIPRKRSPTLAYPATRENANRIDIKITISPVAKTSRSANKRRILNLPTQSCSVRNGTSTSARSSRQAPFRSHPSSRLVRR
jgi:hypothetical protein